MLKLQYKHARKCTYGLLEIVYEKKSGLHSTFTLKCTFCGEYFCVDSEEAQNGSTNSVINTAFVWGALSTGSAYTQAQEIMSVLDVPSMNYPMFQNIENQLGDAWKDTLWSCMEEAGKEEFQIAVGKKQFSEDGTPYIYVHCDGGWSKRSYGHSYNALSGTVSVGCNTIYMFITVTYYRL